MIARVYIVICSMLLGACATSPQGRMQAAVPASISAIHSEVGMQLHLATLPSTNLPCIGMECDLDRAFEKRVLRLGTRLAQSAFETYPELTERFTQFDLVIADTTEQGSTSSAAGSVVIFRGVRKLHLDEEALAFLIAREMGHVISRHHDEDSATSILFSVMLQVLMPVANIVRGSAFLIQSATTTAATTSAASFVGSRLLIESYKTDQLREADVIALNLLAGLGWSKSEIADALVAGASVEGDDRWTKDLRISAREIIGSAKN